MGVVVVVSSEVVVVLLLVVELVAVGAVVMPVRALEVLQLGLFGTVMLQVVVKLGALVMLGAVGVILYQQVLLLLVHAECTRELHLKKRKEKELNINKTNVEFIFFEKARTRNCS